MNGVMTWKQAIGLDKPFFLYGGSLCSIGTVDEMSWCLHTAFPLFPFFSPLLSLSLEVLGYL